MSTFVKLNYHDILDWNRWRKKSVQRAGGNSANENKKSQKKRNTHTHSARLQQTSSKRDRIWGEQIVQASSRLRRTISIFFFLAHALFHCYNLSVFTVHSARLFNLSKRNCLWLQHFAAMASCLRHCSPIKWRCCVFNANIFQNETKL